MNISEPVLEMIKRIEEGKASFSTREGAWGLYYVDFHDVPGHPKIWVAPEYDESSLDWMTKQEKETLCRTIEKMMKQIREQELIKGRQNWKELFGVN